ncbi:MAG TPA: GNAT family N-acetyltransferase [Candidatus Limnocylindria bacterium]|nr:GNAT family N-acetyltransferase [Candidatus Limnocylindria bacterium]
MTEDAIEVRPLTRDRWQDVRRLFGPSGAYANCWCTWWRQSGAEFGRGIEKSGRGNRALLHSLTEAGSEPGLMAYRGDDPIGWISVGPRTEYGRVLRSPMLRPSPEEAAGDTSAWSVVCFWLPRGERRHGVGTALLAAAVQHARDRGARTLEGYPIDTAGGRRAPAGIFTGTLAMFERAGFTEVARRRRERPIVRLTL